MSIQKDTWKKTSDYKKYTKDYPKIWKCREIIFFTLSSDYSWTNYLEAFHLSVEGKYIEHII